MNIKTNTAPLKVVDEAKEAEAIQETKPGIIPDPLDLTKLRLNPSFIETTKVKRVLRVLTGRPSNQDFFRVHPDESYRMLFGMVDLKEDGEDYLVAPDLVPLLPLEVVHKVVYTTINRQGVLRLWSVRVPGEGDHKAGGTWWQSGHEAATMATSKWVRIRADRSLGAYDIMFAESEIPDPDWSAVPSFNELLVNAYGKRWINSLDHGVIKKLYGRT
jgi:hypothetical protein